MKRANCLNRVATFLFVDVAVVVVVNILYCSCFYKGGVVVVARLRCYGQQQQSNAAVRLSCCCFVFCLMLTACFCRVAVVEYCFVVWMFLCCMLFADASLLMDVCVLHVG